MIIKVEQIKSNGKNKFEVKVNNELKYLAGTPWMNIDAPLNAERTRQCVITKTDESICFVTSYNIMENISNTIIPLKWAFTGEQKGHIFNIFDAKNNNCGKFYRLINGFLDTKYVIEYGDYILRCFDISVGKTQNISIYNDDLQIAEIVKPLSVSNNLDYYYLYLLDEYSDLETILSFFTVFFDYQNYANAGEVVGSKKEVSISYTFDKNNKFYDKNWITNHFDNEEVELMNKRILEDRKNNMNSFKKQAKYIILFVALAWLISLVTFGILYFIYHN